MSRIDGEFCVYSIDIQCNRSCTIDADAISKSEKSELEGTASISQNKNIYNI